MRTPKIRALLATVVSVGALALVVATAAHADGPNVLYKVDPNLGAYLGDGSGKALYVFAKDIGGKSACVKDCLEKWPPFHVETPVLDQRVPSIFGTITREDGKRQTTFRGWPLYTFAGDAGPGKIAGDGVNGVWFACRVPFYTVVVGAGEGTGPYLAGPEGRALFAAAGETPEKITCTEGCLKQWWPFYVDRLVVPSTLALSDFTEFKRPDQRRQVAFRGRPLYWANDVTTRGVLSSGNAAGWSLVDPKK